MLQTVPIAHTGGDVSYADALKRALRTTHHQMAAHAARAFQVDVRHLIGKGAAVTLVHGDAIGHLVGGGRTHMERDESN